MAVIVIRSSQNMHSRHSKGPSSQGISKGAMQDATASAGAGAGAGVGGSGGVQNVIPVGEMVGRMVDVVMVDAQSTAGDKPATMVHGFLQAWDPETGSLVVLSVRILRNSMCFTCPGSHGGVCQVETAPATQDGSEAAAAAKPTASLLFGHAVSRVLCTCAVLVCL